MKTFITYLQNGYCGLMEARDLKSAERIALREHGTEHLESVRLASIDDVIHVRSMCGYVPPSGMKMLEKQEKKKK